MQLLLEAFLFVQVAPRLLCPEFYWENKTKKEIQKNIAIARITVLYNLWISEQTSFYENCYWIHTFHGTFVCDLQTKAWSSHTSILFYNVHLIL